MRCWCNGFWRVGGHWSRSGLRRLRGAATRLRFRAMGGRRVRCICLRTRRLRPSCFGRSGRLLRRSLWWSICWSRRRPSSTVVRCGGRGAFGSCRSGATRTRCCSVAVTRRWSCARCSNGSSGRSWSSASRRSPRCLTRRTHRCCGLCRSGSRRRSRAVSAVLLRRHRSMIGC